VSRYSNIETSLAMSTLARPTWSHVVQSRDVRSRVFSRPTATPDLQLHSTRTAPLQKRMATIMPRFRDCNISWTKCVEHWTFTIQLHACFTLELYTILPQNRFNWEEMQQTPITPRGILSVWTALEGQTAPYCFNACVRASSTQSFIAVYKGYMQPTDSASNLPTSIPCTTATRHHHHQQQQQL